MTAANSAFETNLISAESGEYRKVGYGGVVFFHQIGDQPRQPRANRATQIAKESQRAKQGGAALSDALEGQAQHPPATLG